MMAAAGARSLGVHALCAGLSLALAWAAWTHAPTDGRGTAARVVDLDAGGLEELIWEHGQERLVLAAHAGAPELTLVDAGGREERWPASLLARELLAGLPQLRALRALTPSEPAQRVAWGLDANAASLTLRGHRGGRPTTSTLRVGGTTYGANDVFVEGEGGAVYLVAKEIIAPLKQPATRLMDRDAVPIAAAAVERVEVAVEGARRNLALVHDPAGARAHWADAAAPGQRLEEVDAWLDRVVQLRVVRQLEAAPAGAPAVELTLADGGGTRATLALFARTDEGVPAQVSRFARPVLLHILAGEAVLDGARALVAGEPAG